MKIASLVGVFHKSASIEKDLIESLNNVGFNDEDYLISENPADIILFSAKIRNENLVEEGKKVMERF